MTGASTGTHDRCCTACAHLMDDAAKLESVFPGLLILSSAQGDSRGDQGLCRLHDTLVVPTMTCESFLAHPDG